MTQKEALDILKSGHNVFLTGAAGSGKTYVLNAYIDYLKKNNVEVGVTASTGIAATHMGGVTIHSWSGLGIRDSLSPYEIESLEEKRYLWERFDRTKVLIIDEVSMLHHFRLDMVERLARAFKRNEDPFGGMQIVLCGDFFQLPPISRQGERDAHFVFKSDAWQNMDLRVCYLEEQHRQTDDASLTVLNSIRNNSVTDDIIGHLRACAATTFAAGVVPTKLYTHNADVDGINHAELSTISGSEKVYEMRSRGMPILVETLKKSCLAPERLVLKKGARVMFVKNNFEAGYVNGTLGEVTGFDAAGSPLVRISNGSIISVDEASWGVEEDGKVKAEIMQLPLRLAWAITVHKSQGMSLDAVEVDLSKSFVPGMGYVALSRARSLAGLKLIGWNQQALQVSEEILMFDEDLLEASAREKAGLYSLTADERRRMQEGFIARVGGKPAKKKKAKVPTHEITGALLAEKMSLAEIAAHRSMTEDTIISHIEKLIDKNPKLDIKHIRPHGSLLEKIEKAFKKAGDGKLSSAKNILGNGVSYTNLKLARLFLNTDR